MGDGSQQSRVETTATGRPPERNRKVAELVARRILVDADEMGLRTGDQLMPETTMMKFYSVGRASIREALRILEVQGAVTIRTGRGGGPVLERSKTRDVGESLKLHLQQRRATYGDVLVARNALDAQVGWHAAIAATDADKELLFEILSELDGVPPDEYRQLGTTSQRFYNAVNVASHSPVLSLLSQAARDIYSWRAHRLFDRPSYWSRARRAGHRLYAAIASGDSEGARRAVMQELDEETAFALEHFPEVLAERVRWD